jgi:hypothetical protein
MLVMRYTLYAKANCEAEIAKLHRSMPDYGLPRAPHGQRIYSGGDFSPWDVVIYEVDFESLDEYQAYMKEWSSAPRASEWMDKARESVERGGRGELWTVEHLEQWER